MKDHRICIISAMNGKALTMQSLKNKQPSLYVKTLTKDHSQIFSVQKHKSFYVFRHCESKKVLDVYKQKDHIYSDVICYDYHGKQNQLWILQQIPEQGYIIKNQKSKLVIEIEGGIDADGMAIKQNKNYKYLNQLWKFDVV